MNIEKDDIIALMGLAFDEGATGYTELKDSAIAQIFDDFIEDVRIRSIHIMGEAQIKEFSSEKVRMMAGVPSQPRLDAAFMNTDGTTNLERNPWSSANQLLDGVDFSRRFTSEMMESQRLVNEIPIQETNVANRGDWLRDMPVEFSGVSGLQDVAAIAQSGITTPQAFTSDVSVPGVMSNRMHQPTITTVLTSNAWLPPRQNWSAAAEQLRNTYDDRIISTDSRTIVSEEDIPF